ncbi:MAG TPA: hypothetical protein VFB66_25910 [Tepidisphaeraceae bacterium]|nr:hypothetical protein [Tepidisphaeraceae bacterium]
MKLANARADRDTFTSKASELARQLALAGIAIVWIFKTDKPDGPSVPRDLLTPTLFIIVALALDFLHYVYGGAAWSFFHWKKEQREKVDEDAEFKAPTPINWPTNVFYWGKLIAVGVAYALLLRYVYRQLFF